MPQSPDPNQLHAIAEHFLSNNKDGRGREWYEKMAFFIADTRPEDASFFVERYWENLEEQFGACLPWP